ncbi:MAG: CidA/LrgA family protein [Alysiella sp.]|uniref:CidA/LrgA family protein n=1 Tax=Alysiella sp. TaxID=1872483 RepID=UPI0026DB5D99|nr:CidA/LrgA family protein [Alysiella sp.]MDO4433398.1 CidA/LrgA family protein [Alysiella sp.]
MQLMGFLLVFACLFVGEMVVFITGLPLPPSIIGLLLLFTLLSSKKVKLNMVQPVAKTMLDYLAFMVVPACISIIQYLDVIRTDAFPIVLSTILSTLLVLWLTGKTHSFTRHALKNRANNDKGEHDE